jgi:hypothetical protein
MGMRAGRRREQARAFSLRVISGGGGADPHNCPASKKKKKAQATGIRAGTCAGRVYLLTQLY